MLFQLRPNGDEGFSERFFVLSHREICEIQKRRNERYADRYYARYQKQLDFSRGVDNVTVEDVGEHEGKWAKVKIRFERETDA